MPHLSTPARRALLIAGALLCTWAVAIAVSGGGLIEVAGVRLSSRSASRPLLAALGLVVVAVAGATPDQRRRGVGRLAGAAERLAPWMAALLALGLTATSAVFNEHVAGGADSSGYLSQSRLWATGHRTVPAPVFSSEAWPLRGWLVSPLGYAPAATPDELGPSYAPGMPWLMALGAALGGEPGRFVWTPIAAGLVLWLTFTAARRVAPPVVAFAAALLVAGSPPVLFNAMQTMSDLVCTALWTAAILAMTATRPRPWLAGALGALALAVRPNLVVATGLVCLTWLLTSPEPWRVRARRAVVSALPLAVVALAVAWINRRLWGSPVASGYGATEDLFQAANVAGNLSRLLRWTGETAGWWTLAGVPALAWLAVRTRGAAAAGLALAAGLAVSYLPYALFEEWWYLRFYLPAWPLLAAAVAWAAWTGLRRPLGDLAPLAVLALAALGATAGVRVADNAGVFGLWASAQRYPATAAWVRAEAPPQTVIFAVQHSGALAYASGHTIGRWDYVAPDGLDATVETLARQGRTAWLVTDSFEEGPFRARFAAARRGALDWAPLAEVRVRGERVHVFDLTTPTRATAPALMRLAGGPWPWARGVTAAAK